MIALTQAEGARMTDQLETIQITARLYLGGAEFEGTRSSTLLQILAPCLDDEVFRHHDPGDRRESDAQQYQEVGERVEDSGSRED